MPSLHHAARLLQALAICAITPRTIQAQTGFYNTDRGRPVQIEDAYVTERYAAELKLAPVRLERTDAGGYRWSLEPEIALGILPRTQVELGLPLAVAEQGTQRRGGLAGLELSAMHNFNVETEGVPALGLRGDLLLPVGSLGPDRAYSSVTGLATRTYRWARIHVNGQYTFGASREPTDGVDLSRWLIGAAIDKTYPLQSALITAELYGRRPLEPAEGVEYTAGAGTRFQMTPRLALDGGVGRRMNGPERGWYLTFGSAYAFGVRALFPGAR